MEGRETILILSQVYPPDAASVGQHLADTAVELVRRGRRVVVITAGRDYNDPSIKFKRREVMDGVEVRRLPLSSFGKSSMALRILASLFFIGQCIARGLFTRRLAAVLVSTSPPGCALAGVFLGAARRVPTTYWVMDLVPDHLVVTGALSERSLPARMFDAVNRFVLKRVTHVVTLDRYMSQRLNRKLDVTEKLEIMPPWPHDDHVEPVAHADNPFRKEHGLDGKFVIMYSGNHSPYLPLDTVVEAALRLQEEEDLLFMFIGGGLGKKDLLETIERERPRNMVALPYQPFDRIKYSLSAADVHLVSVGDPIVGVGHSCKIYGAMAVARPILALAPARSHLADLVDPNGIGWRVEHGDVDGAVATIREILATDRKTLEAMGLKARRLVCDSYSKAQLLGRFADVVESGLNGAGRRSGTPSP